MNPRHKARVLVWYWGITTNAVQFPCLLAAALAQLPDVESTLCLSADSNIVRDGSAPAGCKTFSTPSGRLSGAWRLATSPLLIWRLTAWLRELRPSFAIDAMGSPFDPIMLLALRAARVPYAFVVHDAVRHRGEASLFRKLLQSYSMRSACAIITLSEYTTRQLEAQRTNAGQPRVITAWHPPLPVGTRSPARERETTGQPRVLFFGRLHAYKGLDLLYDTLRQLAQRTQFEARVVGRGPESTDLSRLRELPGVTVENRWVAEAELAEMLEWADVMVLPYREATQSGVAALAMGAGLRIVATAVGAIPSQLSGYKGAVLCPPEATELAGSLLSALQAPRPQAPTQPELLDGWLRLAAFIAGELKDHNSTNQSAQPATAPTPHEMAAQLAASRGPKC